jgi:hypothetical protein
MLTFESFTGLNNILPLHRLGPTELSAALNVDIGRTGELTRRSGYSVAVDSCHKNLWQANGFMLATVDGGDLVAISPSGARTILYFSLGSSRVWYCNLPDGRTAWSNGLICGITDGTTNTTWGVPVPLGAGAASDTHGQLDNGTYLHQITYVRLSDGLEGGPCYAAPIEIAQGGISLVGLPVLHGHAINVYLTSANGETAHLAGRTESGSFSYTGKNDALMLPCRTDFTAPAPAGTVSAFWRGRVLVAVGSVLYASRTNQHETFDLRRDFKQFTAPITLVQPVDGGVFVGTTEELAFLAGTEFDKLVFMPVLDGPVVLGSGVAVQGQHIQRGDGTGQGPAMICIANGGIVAGFSDGGIFLLTEGRYRTQVTEVSATFRILPGGAPQYLAVPQ